MGRQSRAEIMNCNIRNAIATFFNMTTEERSERSRIKRRKQVAKRKMILLLD